MVMRYGMWEGLGHVAFDTERPTILGIPNVGAPREFSEETAREIDCAVREIVHKAFDKSQQILTERRETLERGAALLLEKETLGEEELGALRHEAAAA
jgi:cell division protease FtsH